MAAIDPSKRREERRARARERAAEVTPERLAELRAKHGTPEPAPKAGGGRAGGSRRTARPKPPPTPPKPPWGDELRLRVSAAVPGGSSLKTIGMRRPLDVVAVSERGVTIRLQQSASEDEPELVPGWTFQAAYDHLRGHGELAIAHLVSPTGLGVKQSAPVCAILAELDDVTATEDPITLHLVADQD